MSFLTSKLRFERGFISFFGLIYDGMRLKRGAASFFQSDSGRLKMLLEIRSVTVTFVTHPDFLSCFKSDIYRLKVTISKIGTPEHDNHNRFGTKC